LPVRHRLDVRLLVRSPLDVKHRLDVKWLEKHQLDVKLLRSPLDVKHRLEDDADARAPVPQSLKMVMTEKYSEDNNHGIETQDTS
jgi:hypothetical protein